MRKCDYNNMPPQRAEEEIDVVELLGRVWLCRRWVISVMVVFLFVGGIVAAAMPEEYDASCDMVPQHDSALEGSRVSSLAALAGINLGYSSRESTLSPLVYENIISSVAFGKELLQTIIYSPREGGYRRLDNYIMAGRKVADEPVAEGDCCYPMDVVTRRDYTCLRALQKRVKLTLDDQKSCLTLTVRMPEALVAAQVAQAAVVLLQQYITEFKIEKVQSNLTFVEERYDEARRHFEHLQSQRARLRDANRNTTRYAAQTALERMDAEYKLALSLYNELAMQLEQARIKVKETMPMLTIIDPVTVPFRRSKPRKMIIIAIFAVAGIAVGAVGALCIPALAEITGCERLRKLLPDEAYHRSERSRRHKLLRGGFGRECREFDRSEDVGSRD